MLTEMERLKKRIEDNNYEILFCDRLSPVLFELPLSTWFEIVKKRPLWWIFRGPFNREMYTEDMREEIIHFLCTELTLADIYLNTTMDWEVIRQCTEVKQSLLQDPRMQALRLMLM